MASNLSRVEAILENTIGYEGVPMPKPQSRVEHLLVELKDAIDSSSVVIDTQVDPNSTNPVQNQAIAHYVDDSVSTNTATFRGTYNSVQELEAVTGMDNNDYAFVVSTDASGNTVYNRYKYTDATSSWTFEYALNNSSFTAAQWATIQSGLTAADKTQIGTNQTDISNLKDGTTAAKKAEQDASGNVITTYYQRKIDSNNKVSSDLIDDTNATNKFVTATDKTNWDGKATTSDITAAINALDVAAVSVSANETLSSVSEADGVISVSKQDIAIPSSQVNAMTGYTKSSSSTPGDISTSDTLNGAIGKVEKRVELNESNISLIQQTIGDINSVLEEVL